MRRHLTAILAVVVATYAAGGVAIAHEHQVCTPGVGDPVLGLEPFHGDDPSNGAILRNPNVTQGAYDTWGMHPLHHFLHIGPGQAQSKISVVRIDTMSCP